MMKNILFENVCGVDDVDNYSGDKEIYSIILDDADNYSDVRNFTPKSFMNMVIDLMILVLIAMMRKLIPE